MMIHPAVAGDIARQIQLETRRAASTRRLRRRKARAERASEVQVRSWRWPAVASG